MENKKFIPKKGQKCYKVEIYSTGAFAVEYTFDETITGHVKRSEYGLTFGTKRLAQICADKLNAVLKESPKVEIPFRDRINMRDAYFLLDINGIVIEDVHYKMNIDYMAMYSGNFFETKELAETSKQEFLEYNSNVWDIVEYLKWRNKE